MAVVKGLEASYKHSQNGMIRSDMEAAQSVAEDLKEVIIFRSTGPWSKRWIERGFPTKNFHVKGKSSNWGPQAGLVPYNGIYSKVGYSDSKAQKGTKANDKGIAGGFAMRVPLVMTKELIDEQLTRAEGRNRCTALKQVVPVPNSEDLILSAERSGDKKRFNFRAVKQQGNAYQIHVYKEIFNKVSPEQLVSQSAGDVLEVMASAEVGANKPMTGDYDLFAICPSWASYGSKLGQNVVKHGIQFLGKPLQPGQAFYAGVGLDNVLDPTLHTHNNHQAFRSNSKHKQSGGQDSLSKLKEQNKLQTREEHPDMGNLTPRILRCINHLNSAMGAVGDKAPFRRVHHNAESHRNYMFGAITGEEMETKLDDDGFGDGFPFTVFQPQCLAGPTDYDRTCTLETYDEFRAYAEALHRAGYYVPKNWVWGLAKSYDISG